MLILTGDLSAVPADYLKWFLICLFGIVAGAGAVLALIGRFTKQTREVRGGPVVVEGEVKVLPKGRRFSAEACDAKHTEITRRLDGHDEQINHLWFTLRDEDAKTRKELNDTFQSIQRALGRIEGKIDDRNKS
jgi:hypothetical protein